MLGVPKNGTTTHVVVPSQHKHKIKHDKTTMQSFLSMPGRHKYYLRIRILINSFRSISIN